jgi:uncharacterized protein YajQ (UPF0234 family)
MITLKFNRSAKSVVVSFVDSEAKYDEVVNILSNSLLNRGLDVEFVMFDPDESLIDRFQGEADLLSLNNI